MAQHLKWREDFNLGTGNLDQHHREILNQINLLMDVVEQGQKKEEIQLVMLRLLRITRIHFHQEEKLMLRHGYPHYLNHRNHHDQMLEQLQELGEGFTLHPLEEPALANFLMDWWITHMQIEDSLLKIFLMEQNAAEPPPGSDSP